MKIVPRYDDGTPIPDIDTVLRRALLREGGLRHYYYPPGYAGDVPLTPGDEVTRAVLAEGVTLEALCRRLRQKTWTGRKVSGYGLEWLSEWARRTGYGVRCDEDGRLRLIEPVGTISSA